MMASHFGHIEVVKVLIKAATINVNYAILAGPGIDSNAEGGTALYIASQQGHAGIVKLLISAFADVNVTQTKTGYSSLMMASHFGHIEVVKALVEAATINVNYAIQKDGYSALIAATQ